MNGNHPEHTLICSLLALAVCAGVVSRALGQDTPGGGKPAAKAPSVLDRLKELDAPSLTAAEKANLGLRLYREEMVNPTPRPKPPYTEFRTHDYVLARITRKLADVDADPATLRRVWESANAGEVKDSLMLFLLLAGTQSVKDAAVRYVLERRNPVRLRELAAEGLGEYAVRENDAALGRVLAQVIREDVQGQYKRVKDKKGERTVLVYPVRRAASEAIRRMEAKGMLLESYVTAAVQRAPAEVPLPKPTPAAAGRNPAVPGPSPGKP